jgi:DNA polymerase-3 subunit alpha
VNRRVVESLVRCGAFDSIEPNRATLFAGLDAALEAGAATQRDRAIGQTSLFGRDGSAAAPEPQLPEAAPWTDAERLAHEKAALGFYVTGHPLMAVRSLLERFGDVTSTTASDRDGKEVRAGGILAALRETRTRRGATMGFATLEDLEGSFDLVIFSESYERSRSLLRQALDEEGEPLPLLVTGTLEAGDPPKILVREMLPLATAEERLASRMTLSVVADELSRDRLEAVRRLFAAHPGPCGVTLRIAIPDESETVVELPETLGVRASRGLVEELDVLFGRPVAEVTV